jgi:predicted nucleic acid-binding protein
MARRNSLKIFSTAVVISDASPLICLAAIRQFNLLRLLHGDQLVRPTVGSVFVFRPVTQRRRQLTFFAVGKPFAYPNWYVFCDI